MSSREQGRVRCHPGILHVAVPVHCQAHLPGFEERGQQITAGPMSIQCTDGASTLIKG